MQIVQANNARMRYSRIVIPLLGTNKEGSANIRICETDPSWKVKTPSGDLCARRLGAIMYYWLIVDENDNETSTKKI